MRGAAGSLAVPLDCRPGGWNLLQFLHIFYGSSGLDKMPMWLSALVLSVLVSCIHPSPHQPPSDWTDLFRCLHLDELLINFLGLLSHLGGGLDFLVFFTGNPELNVFLTELGSKEAPESGKPICSERKLGKAPLNITLPSTISWKK